MRPNRIIAITAAVALAGGSAAVLAFMPSANAASADCQNVPMAVFGPIGCGSIFFPGLGGGPHHYALAVTASSGTFMAPVVAEPIDGGTGQDFTAYRAGPGRYVFQFTPGGNQPADGLGSGQMLCLTDDRGRVVLGMCASRHTRFTEGVPLGPVSSQDGISPAVTGANPSQIWSLRYVGGGAEIVNDHSGRVLDDTAFGGPGTRLGTWQANGGANQVFRVAGATNPYPQMGKAYFGYF